jgi:hypothetical protein
VWVGLVLILVGGIYVPTIEDTYLSSINDSALRVQPSFFAGYHWIFAPPEPESESKNVLARVRTFWRIDTARVLIQWAMVCFVVGGLVWTLGSAKPTAPPQRDSSSAVERD